MQPTTRLWGSIIIILIILAFAEIMAYLASTHLVKYAIGFTPFNITESYEDYLARYHPRLGWLYRKDVNGSYYDAAGSRHIPAFPDPSRSPTCVSLYGDSFCEGYGVDHEHAWNNVLSLLLGCRVANYGISSYGIDQAYLRFVDNRQDQAKVVILSFLSENVMRHVNQLRNLLITLPVCLTKPRFIVNEQGKLTLVPIPHLSKKEYYELQRHPERFLHHEFFLPGGPSGRHKMEFPYTWGIIKVFPLIFNNMVRHLGTYYYLYQSGHPSQAVEVTAAIMEEFSREARHRDKQPLILLIPTHIDVAYYRRVGKWIYQPLTDLLVEGRLNFIDLGPAFVQYLRKSPLEKLYSPQSMYHLNDKGNRLLAKIVYDYVIQQKFLPGAGREIAAGSGGQAHLLENQQRPSLR